MYEFLVANGHDEARILDYSPDKVELLFRAAKRRVARQGAERELSWLRASQAAIGTAVSREGAKRFNDLVTSLMDVIDPSRKKKPEAGIRSMVERLRKFGAQIK